MYIYIYIYVYTHHRKNLPAWPDGCLPARLPGCPIATENPRLFLRFTVPQKGYRRRGSNRQITQTSLLSHLKSTFSWNPF